VIGQGRHAGNSDRCAGLRLGSRPAAADLVVRRAPSGPARAVGSEEAALVWRLPLTVKGNLKRSWPGGS
jgi:hypothetical protein